MRLSAGAFVGDSLLPRHAFEKQDTFLLGLSSPFRFPTPGMEKEVAL